MTYTSSLTLYTDHIDNNQFCRAETGPQLESITGCVPVSVVPVSSPIKRRIDRQKGKVVFFGMGPSLLEIFQLTNLHRVLDIADSRTEAIAKLKS